MDLTSIIFQHYTRSIAALDDKNHDFVHYTNAEVAVSILKNRQMWFRNARLMNDFKEIEYGLEALKYALDTDAGTAFKDAINSIESGIADTLLSSHFDLMNLIKTEIYMTCISEHLGNEDKLGRLSMWRAYGGTNGVAIVLKRRAIIDNPSSSGIILSPVAYLRPDEMSDELALIAKSIKDNKETLRSIDRKHLTLNVYRALLFAVACTKHPGFSEEREWRLLYNDTFGTGPDLVKDISVIKGTPQRLVKLNFAPHDYPNSDRIKLIDVVSKIIIGPCEYPEETAQAFREILYDAGFASPIDIVEVSSIPLRQ